MMRMNAILLLAAAGATLLIGCTRPAQRAPALTVSAAAAQPPAPPEKSFLSRTADATWNVVSAPVRLVTPQKKPAPKPPEVYEAPEAVIIVPAQDADAGMPGATSQSQ